MTYAFWMPGILIACRIVSAFLVGLVLFNSGRALQQHEDLDAQIKTLQEGNSLALALSSALNALDDAYQIHGPRSCAAMVIDEETTDLWILETHSENPVPGWHLGFRGEDGRRICAWLGDQSGAGNAIVPTSLPSSAGPLMDSESLR